MAKPKLVPCTPGTAIVPAVPRPVVVNADLEPNADNPHSQLPLIGDPTGTKGLRILFGVLRSRYRDFDNSAVAFIGAKLRPSWSADPHRVTAIWAETLAPAEADDSFADAMLLAHRIDHEIARDAAGKTPLLAYATITDPEAVRIHVFREELRGVARRLADDHGVAVVAVVHAPGRAGSGNPLHGHLCISTAAVNGSLGFGARNAALCGDKGRDVILDAWGHRTRFV